MNTFISLLVFFSKAKRLLVESLTGHTEESKRNAGNDIVFFPVFSDRKGNEDWKETSAIEHYKQRTVYGISFSFGASPHSHRRGVALHRQPAVRCSVSFLSLSLSHSILKAVRTARGDATTPAIPYPARKHRVRH